MHTKVSSAIAKKTPNVRSGLATRNTDVSDVASVPALVTESPGGDSGSVALGAADVVTPDPSTETPEEGTAVIRVSQEHPHGVAGM
ncbi:hypothetical protein MAHJHV63_16360 [Mycobacterium avium subsp. hominissuis]